MRWWVWSFLVLIGLPALSQADVNCQVASTPYIPTVNVTGAPTGYPFTVAGVVKMNTATGTDLYYDVFGVGRRQTGFSVYIHNISTSSMGLGVTNWNSALDVEVTGALVAGQWYYFGISFLSSSTYAYMVYDYAATTWLISATSTAANLGTLVAPGTRLVLCNHEDSVGAIDGNSDITVRWLGLWSKDMTVQNGMLVRAMAHHGPYSVATPGVLYTFQEGTGTTVFDHRRTGNDGTMSSALPWVTAQRPAALFIP